MKQETSVHSMAYPLSSPKGNPNSEKKVPLKDPIREGQQLSIIENKSLKLMISIRKESLNPQANPYPKHQENASIVEKDVISERSVNKRPKPLSTLQLVTKPARMRSSNSQNLTAQTVSLPVVLVTMISIRYTSHLLNPLEHPLVPLVAQMLVWHAKIVVVGTRLSMFSISMKSYLRSHRTDRRSCHQSSKAQ